MNWQLATAVLLGLGAALAVARAARRGADRPRDWSLWLSVPAAGLLYFVLFPPIATLRADALSIVTAGATRAEMRAAPTDQLVVNLTGAPAPPGAESAADLATALRMHAGVSRVRIIGGGLSARDRPAARATADASATRLQFAAAERRSSMAEVWARS